MVSLAKGHLIVYQLVARLRDSSFKLAKFQSSKNKNKPKVNFMQACHQESATRRVLRLLRTAVEIAMTTSINQIYFVYFETLVLWLILTILDYI